MAKDFVESVSILTSLLAIGQERRRQETKWGTQDHDDPNWLAILAEEFGEVAKEVTEGCVPPAGEVDIENLRAELVQTAAVAAAWIEALDRRSK